MRYLDCSLLYLVELRVLVFSRMSLFFARCVIGWFFVAYSVVCIFTVQMRVNHLTIKIVEVEMNRTCQRKSKKRNELGERGIESLGQFHAKARRRECMYKLDF